MRLMFILFLGPFLAGCGGSDESSQDRTLGAPSGGEAAPPGRGTTVVAALGDSITAGSPGWNPDPAIRAQAGDGADPRSQYGYWAERRLEGARFRNCAVPGERTDEIARRLDRCAKGADVLLVQGGINDIAQMRDVGLAAADLRRMARRGRQLGLRVMVVEVLPWNNGHPAADPRIRRLNMLIRQIGTDERVRVLDWHERLEDPEARGRMKREWTADGDHPSVEGYRRLGETITLP